MSKARISDAFFVVVSLICTGILGCGPPMWAEQAVAAGDAARTAASRPAQRPSVPADLLADRLQYALQDGYVHSWLVAGPLALPADEAAVLIEANAVLSSSPAENASFTIASEKLTWRYGRAMDDHLVDLSAYYEEGQQVYAWAYAQLWSPVRQEIRLVLSADGPAHLWLNGEQVHRQASQGKADARGTIVPATLALGLNEILVRFSQTGSGRTPYAMALQVTGFEDGQNGPEVLLPTTAQDVDRRRALEQLLDQAALERAVHHRGNEILLHWTADLEGQGSYTYQVQDARNRIYLEGFAVAEPSQSLNVGHPARIWEGDYDVVLGPRPEEYYEQNLRYQRRIPIHIVDNAYSEQPYGTYEGRWQEALEDAARRYDAGLYTEIAKLALGREVDGERIRQATLSMDAHPQGSDADMVGLLGALYRYGHDAALPPTLLAQIDAFIPQSLYWDNRPAEDRSAATADGHNILYATAQILAGQRYPEQRFAGTGATGAWHREQGEDAALAWLHQRATVGFGVWGASSAFQAYAVALSHLCDLAEAAQIREMATAVLDKMLFTMALNSYKGVFGSTHGSTSGAVLKSGQLEPTSGMSRLLWGMGLYNRHIRGTVSVAVSAYRLPPVIAGLSTDLPEELWSRERHAGAETRRWLWWSDAPSEVNTVTYRTPDYMLSSAQDYRPGEAGAREHVWQATLGPDAIVYVTHPANAHVGDARAPGFWVGNRSLPRVAQWKDTLVAVYSLPEDDWLGFTHAYWPAYAFDESAIRDGWAFARVGEGYVALTAAAGIEPVHSGPGAYHELRSYGQRNTWVCLMGRRAVDGSFDAFQEAVLALDIDLGQDGVQLRALHGEQLSFGWRGALRIDGSSKAIAGFKHYECPYATVEMARRTPAPMDIRHGDRQLSLTFAAAR